MRIETARVKFYFEWEHVVAQLAETDPEPDHGRSGKGRVECMPSTARLPPGQLLASIPWASAEAAARREKRMDSIVPHRARNPRGGRPADRLEIIQMFT